MKKSDFIKMFFIGGSIGITLIRASYIIVNILMGLLNSENMQELRVFFLTFIFGGICFTIASISIQKLEHRDMSSVNRQKALKRQLKIISAIIVFFTVILVVYIFKKVTLGIILALSFITVFFLWGYGCLLSYLNLKNNMAMINIRNQQT